MNGLGEMRESIAQAQRGQGGRGVESHSVILNAG